MPWVDASNWLEDFIAQVGGGSLSDEDRETILELAGVAAHASERMAAPLTCWVAAKANLTPAMALELARSLAAESVTDSTETT
jgi:hypothetical protein